MNSRIAVILCVALLFLCGLAPSLASAQAAPTLQPVADKQSVLGHARASYYNLRSEGLASFQCNIIPDWQVLLAEQRKANPEGVDAAIRILSQIRFTVTLDSDGKVQLTHNELAGQSDEMNKALAQIYGGMEQMTSGFFDTWKVFMLSPPLPEVSSEFQLASAANQYQLSYKEAAAAVATTLNKDFSVADMKIRTADFDSTIQPSFTKAPNGFVLSAYNATYKSANPGETAQLKVLIDYQELEGLQMLRNLNLSGTYGGTPFAVQLAFSDYQIAKSPAPKTQARN